MGIVRVRKNGEGDLVFGTEFLAQACGEGLTALTRALRPGAVQEQYRPTHAALA
jgi:hypothetical protein